MGGEREPGSSRRRSNRDCRTHERSDRRSRSQSRSRRTEELPSPETSDSEVEASPFVGRYTGGTGCLATQSLRQVDTVCGTHTYSLAGYTLARAMGPGTRLCSDLFEVGGQLFRLEVYPAGLDAACHKYLGLFLTTPGSCRPGHLLYELSVMDKSTLKPVHITESRTAATPPPPAPATLQAPAPGVVAGFPRFVKSNFLHRNSRRFLHDDTLTIRATVKMLTGWSSFPVQPPPAPQVFALHPTSPGALAAATAATGAVGGGGGAGSGLTLIPPSAALPPQQTQTQTVVQLQPQHQQLVYSGLQSSVPVSAAGGAGYVLASAAPSPCSQHPQLQQAAGWMGCPCPCSGGGALPAQHHQGFYGSAGGAPALLYTQLQPQPQAAAWQSSTSLPYGGVGGTGAVGVNSGSGPPLTYGYGGAAALLPAQGTAPAVLQAGVGGQVYGHTMMAATVPPHGTTVAWQAPPVAVGTAPF